MGEQRLADAIDHVRAEAREACGSGRVPGVLAGVFQGGEQAVVAEGFANLVTGASMTEDTAFSPGRSPSR